eukprot:gene5326-5358_t
MDCQSDCVTTPLLALSCRVCPTSFAYSFEMYHICRALVRSVSRFHTREVSFWSKCPSE